jgi:uncharacterized membrane protein YfcA
MTLDTLALLLAAASAAGFVSGLFGVGGGIVMVPVLTALAPALGWPPEATTHFAVATSVAAVVPTAISSGRTHWRAGTVDRDLLRVWALPMAVAALVAGAVAAWVPTRLLGGVFAGFAALVGLRLGFGDAGWTLRDRLPGTIAQRAVAAAVGWLSSWMGVGAGTLGVPAMTALGVPMHRAVGTAAVLGIAVSAPSLVGWLVVGANAPDVSGPALGYLQLVPWAAMVVPMVAIAPAGARAATRLPAARLRKAFGFFLIAVAAALAVRLV